MADRSETTPTREEIVAGRVAADEEWKRWTGGRSGLDGMEFFVRVALEAAAKVRNSHNAK